MKTQNEKLRHLLLTLLEGEILPGLRELKEKILNQETFRKDGGKPGLMMFGAETAMTSQVKQQPPIFSVINLANVSSERRRRGSLKRKYTDRRTSVGSATTKASAGRQEPNMYFQQLST